VALTILYFDEVKTDIAEAKDWYKNQKPGLEKDFAREVKRSILRLQKNPIGYEVKYKSVRTAFTDVFPYAVHFYIDEPGEQLVIIAVVHQSRNPAVYNKS